MLGRGGESNYHTGNLAFRSFIQEHKKRYQKARKQEKPIIALEVVLAWRDLSPPGRFLARMDNSRADSLWYDVGDDAACKRAGRTLGERCATKSETIPSGKSNGSGQAKEDLQPEAVWSKKRGPDTISSSGGGHDDPTKKAGSSSGGRSKRPRAALDYIASFTSAKLMGGGGLAGSKKERLQPKSQPPFLKKASSSSSSSTFELRQSEKFSPGVVSPESCHARVAKGGAGMMKMKDDLPHLEIGSILEGCQRRHAIALEEDIPTAEFLTRTAFLDY